VGNLTPAPYVNGAAKVVHVAADGTVTDAITGLTAVTGVAVGDDGTLYAVEMSTGNTEEPPFMVPSSGRLVRQSGADSFDAVVSGLMFPAGLKAGPDGALYVALPAFGSDDGSGQIVRVDVTSGAASPVAETMREAPECALPVEGTLRRRESQRRRPPQRRRDGQTMRAGSTPSPHVILTRRQGQNAGDR